jgi:hypothetical protein
MPRICTEGPVQLYETLGDEPSSTFDVCAWCLDHFGGDGAPWPDHPGLEPYNGEENVPGLIIASGIDHPLYEDNGWGDEYNCAACDVVLTYADD